MFEGPYRNVRKWTAKAIPFVKEKAEAVRKMYRSYTTCPKCAKKYGKSYVVIPALV